MTTWLDNIPSQLDAMKQSFDVMTNLKWNAIYQGLLNNYQNRKTISNQQNKIPGYEIAALATTSNNNNINNNNNNNN